MERFQQSLQALRELGSVVAVGRSGGSLDKIGDLAESFLGTPQMEQCIARFRALPGGAELMDERYQPKHPDLEELAGMAPGSLGHAYAKLIRGFNYDPEFFRQRPVDMADQWLIRRIASTHDIHHVVSGFGTDREGESGVLAITASQVGFPPYVSLNHAVQLSIYRLQLPRYPAVSRAISHGHTIGFTSAPFCTARWEEGWELPVQEWRQRLGVIYPADQESYGLAPE
ncbi:MAG: Coq4 family protein [Synechococcaceae cyanobacterium ELA739]